MYPCKLRSVQDWSDLGLPGKFRTEELRRRRDVWAGSWGRGGGGGGGSRLWAGLSPRRDAFQDRLRMNSGRDGPFSRELLLSLPLRFLSFRVEPKVPSSGR